MTKMTPEDQGHLSSEAIEGFARVETGTIALYRSHYDRIFWDLDHAASELAGPQIDYANLIHAAAHLRLVIEAVVMASFTASRALFLEADRSMQGAKDFGQMVKAVKQLNPHYWPTSLGPIEGSTKVGVRATVGISEAEVGRHFGTVSELLHIHNPFAKQKPGPDKYLVRLRDLVEGLQDLLCSHIVQLAQSPECLYLRRSEDGRISAQAFITDGPLL